MDTILTAVHKYTTGELTADGDPLHGNLANAVEQAASAVVRTEEELGQTAGWVADKTDRVRRALAAHPGQPLPTLNPLGELQAHAPRFDALISERAAHRAPPGRGRAAGRPPDFAAHHRPPHTDHSGPARTRLSRAARVCCRPASQPTTPSPIAPPETPVDQSHPLRRIR
jgi:hypothetical protein